MIRRRATLVLLALGLAAPALAQAPAGPPNDYPTTVRADYVLACMAANGGTRPALERCSCSIDAIAALIPYARYVEAETVLSMLQIQGRGAEMFRSTAQLRDAVSDLRRAQAEAEVQCFP